MRCSGLQIARQAAVPRRIVKASCPSGSDFPVRPGFQSGNGTGGTRMEKRVLCLL